MTMLKKTVTNIGINIIYKNTLLLALFCIQMQASKTVSNNEIIQRHIKLSDAIYSHVLDILKICNSHNALRPVFIQNLLWHYCGRVPYALLTHKFDPDKFEIYENKMTAVVKTHYMDIFPADTMEFNGVNELKVSLERGGFVIWNLTTGKSRSVYPKKGYIAKILFDYLPGTFEGPVRASQEAVFFHQLKQRPLQVYTPPLTAHTVKTGDLRVQVAVDCELDELIDAAKKRKVEDEQWCQSSCILQ